MTLRIRSLLFFAFPAVLACGSDDPPAGDDDGPRQALRRRLRGAGFSAVFSDTLLAGLPPEAQRDEQADHWLQRQLQRRLSVAAPGDLEQPGVIALIGPTGVGKTYLARNLADEQHQRNRILVGCVDTN